MANKTAKPTLTIDVAPLFEDQWTGIPVFTRRLIQALQASRGVNLEFAINCTAVATEAVNGAIRMGTGSFLREEFNRRTPQQNRLADLGSKLLFPSVNVLPGLGRHEASTVHDLSTLFMPENHIEPNIAYHLDGFCKELRSNELVLCVSEATRQALVAAFPSAKSKAQVIYQYVDWPEYFADMDANAPPMRIGRYALVVGTVEPRKNLGLLIEALTLAQISRLDLRFVVIGRKGWKVDAFLAGLTDAQRERIAFTGFVSEFMKYRLLKNCEFLIFPSLYEGFGIPAVEAMSLGKAVLGSRTSSFPEVIHDAGIYFDPISVQDFADALNEMLGRAKDLEPLALAQGRTFNAARMAAPVLEWVHCGS